MDWVTDVAAWIVFLGGCAVRTLGHAVDRRSQEAEPWSTTVPTACVAIRFIWARLRWVIGLVLFLKSLGFRGRRGSAVLFLY